MSLSKNTIILIIAAAVVIMGGVYYFFFYTKDSGSAVVASSAPASDAELTFINLVGQLNPISFDASLFSDPRFQSRTDIRTTVVPETSGRKDPFASIGK